MPTINIPLDTVENKLELAITIGDKHFKDIAGTEEEKEYRRILQNIGFRVLMHYRNMTKRAA